MFDHEKMSEKDQQRYAEEMQAAIDFPPNGGAPKHAENVKAGLTWSHERKLWYHPVQLGAVVSKAPEGWQGLFSEFHKRYAYPRRLKVVSIVYDWKVFN